MQHYNSIYMTFLVSIILVFVRIASGYPWGTDRCGGPDHSGGYSGSQGGLNLAMDSGNTVVLSSSRSFRGFFLQTDKLYSWSNPSSNSGLLSVCGGSGTAVAHTNSARRSMTQATVQCTGGSFRVTAYVVYSYSSSFDMISQTFSFSSSVANTTSVPQGQNNVGQFDSLGMANVQWTPSSNTPTSDVVVLFSTQGNDVGWFGLGFGADDHRMTGGKPSVVVSKNRLACAVEFYSLESNNVQLVGPNGTDPWNVTPACTVLSSSVVRASFTLGRGIPLPNQGTSVYVLLAGGTGQSLSNHGRNWDYKQVDFLSTDAPSGGLAPVNPYYLAHGVLFILLFSVLMPLTAFLILINRARFYNTHKYLGILIIFLLTAGWILVNPGESADESGNYAGFSDSDIGSKHADIAGIGCWIAVGVCSLGVVLWFIKLPRTMRRAVRYAHGIAGIGLSYWGPYVVWTGWVQLTPLMPPENILDSTPWVWYSLAVLLGAIYIVWKITAASLPTKDANSVQAMNGSDIEKLIKQGKVVLIVNGMVCDVPKNFSHPGGRQVLEQFNGQDVSRFMRGIDEFTPLGKRSKKYAHSQDAFEMVKGMQIGHIDERPVVVPDEKSLPVEEVKIVGKILSMERVNEAVDFPVRLFRIQMPKGAEELVYLGSRVYIGINAVKRPYTVCRVEGQIVDFCIKIYPQGAMTSRLNRMKPGHELEISNPMAHPAIATNPKLIVFVAGGTGITPMIGYMKDCLKSQLGGILLWWVRNEGDLFLTNELQQWARMYNIAINIFFTQPRKQGEGHRQGRISVETILSVFENHRLPVDPASVCWIMSGPEGFVSAAHGIVGKLGSDESRIISLD
jgi:ferredoxin-NADP reductase